MKRESSVNGISHEVPIILEKALKMFIIELTYRSYVHTLYNKRKTLRVILNK
jgi:nuclear transcription factor Y gamma